MNVMASLEPTEAEKKSDQPILKTGEVSGIIESSYAIRCDAFFIGLLEDDINKAFTFLNHGSVKENINEMLNRIQKRPLQILGLYTKNMPIDIVNHIEQQLKLRRISYFVTNKKSNVGILAKNLKEIIWHGIPILIDATNDLFKITIGIRPGLSKTYKSIFYIAGKLKIEVMPDYIKIENPFIGEYTICFPDEMFPELKFCRLLVTPSGTAWYDFLFRGLYDPRLLCLVWAFASKN